MRQPAIAFTTLLATTLAMTNVVYADEQADKQAIMKASRAFDAAIERKDVNQAFADRAPEYTLIDRNGKLTNLEQNRQGWRQSFQTIRQINLNNEIKQIQINGQTATVISIEYRSVIISNPKNPQVPVRYSGVGQYQHIWKRTPGGWKLLNTNVLQYTATGQQSSQANRRKLTPAQELIKIMQYQQMMRFNNNATCMASGFSCGF